MSVGGGVKRIMVNTDTFGLPNYTGPYISNGKFQSSVEFGSENPKDELDALSRLHDSAYAKWPDRLHRTVADAIYNEEARKLREKFPELAGFIVLYGNQAMKSAKNLYEGIKYGLLGLVAAGVMNMYDLNNYMLNGSRTRQEVLAYYATDPKLPENTSKALHIPIEHSYEDPLLKDVGIKRDSLGNTTYNPEDDRRLPENQAKIRDSLSTNDSSPKPKSTYNPNPTTPILDQRDRNEDASVPINLNGGTYIGGGAILSLKQGVYRPGSRFYPNEPFNRNIRSLRRKKHRYNWVLPSN